MIKTLLLCPLILSYCLTLGQHIYVEPIDDCLAFIKNFHYEKKATEQKALNLYKEKKWYNFLPRPGLGYDFITGRPLVTLESPDFISFINRKKELNYKLHQSEITNSEKLNNDTVAFISGYAQLMKLIELHLTEKVLISKDSLLLKLKIEENKRLQATTEDVLKIENSILERKYNHQKAIMVIMSKAQSLEPYLHRNLKVYYND